jgi:hypothetical protein
LVSLDDAADLIDDKEIDILQNLAIDTVFEDFKKETNTPQGSLPKF